ncbi:MAG: AMP-binding protein [Pseudolabrys sp.]
MILGEAAQGGDRFTLDDLFRRAGVRRADALALIDPPNAASITGAAPRTMTFAQADRAISALAARLRALGLPTDAVVAIQLPNTVDSVIALLGVMRARLIAAPLPLLWRKQEMVAALSRTGAKAIVAAAHIGASAPAETAVQVAAELFPIRHICGFGRGLPDGVVPLDDCLAPGAMDFFAPPARPGNPGAHVAAITFDVTGDGLAAVARSHSELIAGGVAVHLESGMAEDTTILSAIPPGSFAGIALGMLPWLLSGGALALHHGFDPAVFAAQCHANDVASVVVPGRALTPLANAGLLGPPVKTILALWRAPERLAAAKPWQGEAALVDVASFGEVGLLPARRGRDGLALPIPLGAVATPRGVAGARAAIETRRGKTGTLTLRGPMVPPLAPDAEGFVDTGFPCGLAEDGASLTVTGSPAGLSAVGFYRFRQREIDAAVASADPAAVIAALPDAALGTRLAGSARDPAAIAADLQARGVNSLIAGAFGPRGKANAA